MRPGHGKEEPGPAPPPRDIDLTPEDRDDLLSIVAQVAASSPAARRILRPLGYPEAAYPAWAPGMTAEQWWDQVFVQFDLGVLELAFLRLTEYLTHAYQANPVLRALNERYIVGHPTRPTRQPQPAPQPHPRRTPQPAPQPQASPAAEPAMDRCRVIVRATTEEEREAATRALQEQGLQPRETWSTEYVVSYAVGSGDPGAVRRVLAQTDLGWTVVAPGEPDYVIRTLYVQGPDGSRFRLTDTPAQQTFRNVAEEVTAEYEGADVVASARSAVIDRINRDGTRRRVNPDHTLHEEGVQEEEQLGIGLESRAGAVNPQYREDALHRIRHQILEYARGFPMVVRANSATLPSEYELEFDQDSFGPPTVDGGDPVEISHHRVLVELGPEFPETSPMVFWQSPIFHPNVFPNYDCEDARGKPHLRGLVCLGELADAWYPAMAFGTVCQMLVEMAGYRNYDLYEVTVSPDDQPQLRANFFDKAAADWAVGHQREIIERGGSPVVRPAEIRPKRRRNVIDPLD